MGLILSVLRLTRRNRRLEADVARVPKFARFGVTESQGDRAYMEDFTFSKVEDAPGAGPRGFFVVCDGHGGADAARFASQNLLRFLLVTPGLRKNLKAAISSSFLRTDAEIQKQVAAGKLEPSGTTALVSVLTEGKLVVASLGDCRAILSNNGRAKEVGTEHKPDSPTERKRIEAAGGFVDCEGYLNGDLNVSRALGDFHFPDLKHVEGKGPLIADPEITEVEIEESSEFLVLSSDGIWMQSQTVVNIVRDSLRKQNCPLAASKALVDHALRCESKKDNISVIVICLKKDPPPMRQRMANSNSRLNINRE